MPWLNPQVPPVIPLREDPRGPPQKPPLSPGELDAHLRLRETTGPEDPLVQAVLAVEVVWLECGCTPYPSNVTPWCLWSGGCFSPRLRFPQLCLVHG